MSISLFLYQLCKKFVYLSCLRSISLVSFGLRKLEAISGTIPKATIIEEVNTNIIGNGKLEVNSHVTPEIKNSGANTAIVVAVPLVSGQWKS